MSTERADIEVNLNGNKHGLSQMLREASKEVRSFAKETGEEVASSWSPKALASGVLGYFGLESIMSAVEGFIERAKGVKELAEELGMGAEETERWAVAAKSAGFEMNKIANVLSVIQEKRLQAQNDPKVREQLNLLGVSDQSIFNEKVTPGDIASHLATEGFQNQKLLYQLLGSKAVRTLIGTVGKLPGTKSDLSGAEIEEGAQMGEGKETFYRFWQNMWGRTVLGLVTRAKAGSIGWASLLTDPFQSLFNAIGKTAGLNIPIGPGGKTDRQTVSQFGAMLDQGDKAAFEAEKEASRQRQFEYDKKQEEHELKMHDLKAEELEADRGLMTIGARRESIQKEMLDIQKEINDLYDAPAEINGKNTEERIAKLKIQELHLRKQLIERPTEWQTKAAAFAAAGGTTFGGTAQHVQGLRRDIQDLHDTIKRNGTF